ncbi:MAG: hypothetical protein JXB05_28890 [Myxococcaceae bacterium]|nr:hypothetical protein [Myxococcaceae bacterium]
MPSIRNLLCAALTVGVLLSAPSAEARFGKRSTSSESSDKKTHDASAVGDDDDDDDDAPRSRSSSAGSFLVELLFAIFLEARVGTSVSTPPPAPQGELRAAAPQPSPTYVRLGVDGAAMNTVAGLSAFLSVEGERVGLDGRALGLLIPTDDGTRGVDNINLTNLHLTVALLTHEKARLRVEGGISSAHAPDLTVLGPSLALSFEACLAGALDLELRAQGTPYPHRQLDAQAGLAVHLNYLVLRGGWRALYLNDNGLVDDVVHEDAFGGPYLGLGFAF